MAVFGLAKDKLPTLEPRGELGEVGTTRKGCVLAPRGCRKANDHTLMACDNRNVFPRYSEA